MKACTLDGGRYTGKPYPFSNMKLPKGFTLSEKGKLVWKPTSKAEKKRKKREKLNRSVSADKTVLGYHASQRLAEKWQHELCDEMKQRYGVDIPKVTIKKWSDECAVRRKQAQYDILTARNQKKDREKAAVDAALGSGGINLSDGDFKKRDEMYTDGAAVERLLKKISHAHSSAAAACSGVAHTSGRPTKLLHNFNIDQFM